MFTILLLALVWVVLNGSFTVFNVLVGLAIGAVSYFFAIRFMWPAKIFTGVKFTRLVFYPFYLIYQMYISGFVVLKMIIFGCRTEVVTVNTALKNDFLRTLLCNSITMIPGSVLLNQEDDELTVMLLREKDSVPFAEDCDVGLEVKGRPEAILLQAEGLQ
ncbi:MAG: Na+/H+ antiporter subunit E [Defluviitaleaceae bacterium]|nr:Na+/H+ antiporter subunit E [Defluviitaleaceae bacterium]